MKKAAKTKLFIRWHPVWICAFLVGFVAVENMVAEAVEMRSWIEQYSADIGTLNHRYPIPMDEFGALLRQKTLKAWRSKLSDEAFGQLDRVGQIDFLLLRSELDYQLAKQRRDSERDKRAAKLLPYHQGLVEFARDRENVEPLDPRSLATSINELGSAVEKATTETTTLEGDSDETTSRRLAALRAVELLEAIQGRVKEANRFYQGYDPLYSWWVNKPMERLLAAIDSHRIALREKMVGVPESDKETIIGLPIGAEGLKLELQHEWIAHTPAELVALAKREMAWCDAQMALASKQLGFGDDWRAAMDHVKLKHVEPGDQPKMIRELAWEAIRFLNAHDLITVPPLAATGWRMTMMSPERQRVNPYFLGGDSIIVSFPTNTMTHDEKLMSMRSNNEHFSRATVHHELIPGHHLQYYMLRRYRPYRSLFRTPFWIEGWALYWEMLLWDLDFAQGPEDRVGMLFWRKHRCARIIFSLSYHLGTMTPEECIDYLVDRVGHEKSAATAEVRRSIMGGYSPLYQAAYMLGGLQLRKMHAEFVQGGRMTNREFHDTIMHENYMPIEVLRLYMSGQDLHPNAVSNWRFAD